MIHFDVKWVFPAEKIKKEWFKNVKKVGITAGASTPDWIIKEVIDCCLKL